MKTKLALLAAVTLIGIGATRAIAGRVGNDFPATPATAVADKPAAKGCCGMNQAAAAKPADATASTGMSCHAAQPGAPVARKSCCK